MHLSLSSKPKIPFLSWLSAHKIFPSKSLKLSSNTCALTGGILLALLAKRDQTLATMTTQVQIGIKSVEAKAVSVAGKLDELKSFTSSSTSLIQDSATSSG